MVIVDPGHVYLLRQLGEGHQEIRFVKRSGGAIKYSEEWDGLQAQEVLRALIDRTEYLNEVIPCTESQDAVYHMRMALFMYETRAYRRKRDKKNRRRGAHDDTARPKGWRPKPFADVPFGEEDIEKRPIGEDGHILIEEEEENTHEL